MHNSLTRQKAQTIAYADTQNTAHSLLQRKHPKIPPATRTHIQETHPPTQTNQHPKHQYKETPPPGHRKPPPTQPKQRATGVIPINKESKIYYETYKPQQRRDTTTTPSNTPQTRAPSPTKTPDQGLPNNYSPKMDKTKTPKQVPNHHTTKEKQRKGAPPRPRQPPHPLYRAPRFPRSNPPPSLAPPLASPFPSSPVPVSSVGSVPLFVRV